MTMVHAHRLTIDSRAEIQYEHVIPQVRTSKPIGPPVTTTILNPLPRLTTIRHPRIPFDYFEEYCIHTLTLLRKLIVITSYNV